MASKIGIIDGVFKAESADAIVTVTTVDSPALHLKGAYWDGDGSEDSLYTIRNDVFDTINPYGQLVISNENAGGAYFIARVLAAATYLYGGDTTGDDLLLYGNTTDTKPVISVNGGGSLILDAANGFVVSMAVNGTSHFNVGENTITIPRVSGTTTITTGSVLGVARAIHFDIPISEGGASGAALDYQFKLDGELVAGLLSDTNGTGGFEQSVWKIPSNSGAYGATWATYTPPAPTSLINGAMVVAYNSDTTSSRLYVYSNNAWTYVALS